MTDIKLLEFIKKVKKTSPADNKLSVESYFTSLKRDCNYVLERFWDEAVNYYETEEIFDKPLVYFRAILVNKQKEYEKQKLKEQRALGTLPEAKR